MFNRLAVVMAVFALGACSAPSALSRPVSAPPVLIRDVHVLDIETGSLSPRTSVRVEAGVIAAIGGSEIPDPANTRIVDAQGGVLMPGLVDMHVHVFDEVDLAANLAYGVTTLRNLGGLPFHRSMAERIERGHLLGPRLVTTGAILNQRDGRNVNILQTLVHSPDAARRAVRRQHRAGHRHLKLYSNLSRENFAVIREEADRLGMTLSGHPIEGSPDDPLGLADTLAADFVTIEHMESLVWFALQDDRDLARGQALAETLAAHQARLTPTLIVHHNLARIVETRGAHLDRPGMDSFNPVVRWSEQGSYDYWAGHSSDERSRMQAFYVELTGLMHAAGVEIVVGTDAGVMATPHGISVSEEIELLVAAGLTPLEALQAATLNPARALDLETEIGRVAAGYRADLVLLDGNPIEHLSTLRRPVAVARDGVWLDAGRLSELREASAQPSRLRTGWRVLNHLLQR
ncbi:amidohydrolase family protein [Maricaulis sp. CAU 1757]